ncbi:MAG: hypothetical protein HQL70_04270 [Magnetococcales bacterium]|nr:hypothetical protein [Magnetococcales bacterium]
MPASLGNDSATYMLMARHLSPFVDNDPIASDFYHRAPFPPGFPLFLAYSGVSHDFRLAHAAVTLCFLLGLGLFFLFLRRQGFGSTSAGLTVMVYCLSPVVWTNVLGMLSESLYMSLTFAFLLMLPLKQNSGNWRYWGAAGLILGWLWLTRSIGVAMVLAQTFVVFIRRLLLGEWVKPGAVALFIAVTAQGVWQLVKPPATHYGEAFQAILNFLSSDPANAIYSIMVKGAINIGSNWLSGLMLYWVEATSIQFWLGVGLGLIALCGLVYRMWQLQTDGWYLFFYLLILFIWPFPDAMSRFLFPVFPLLLFVTIYSFSVIVCKLFRLKHEERVRGLAVLLLAILILPSLGFAVGRATYGSGAVRHPYSYISEFYQMVDIKDAKTYAQGYSDAMADMKLVALHTKPGEVVLWVKPNFLALLAGRPSRTTPKWRGDQQKFIQAVADTGATYVYISGVTGRGNDDGLQAMKYFSPIASPIWQKIHKSTGQLKSALLLIKHEKLLKEVPDIM